MAIKNEGKAGVILKCEVCDGFMHELDIGRGAVRVFVCGNPPCDMLVAWCMAPDREHAGPEDPREGGTKEDR